MNSQLENILDDTEKNRSKALFEDFQLAIHQRTDRLFVFLMLAQWIGGIIAAIVISPQTWEGTVSSTHIHVWAAILIGGALTSLPVYLCYKQPGQVLNRHVVAVAQMLTSALLIHLTGGRIETHFHVFGSLAFLAFYRDRYVILTATLVVAIDHFVRGAWWPQSVFGVMVGSHWRWIEHAGWVIFENIFLFISIHQSLNDMHNVSDRQAKTEHINVAIENRVIERTQELHQEILERKRAETTLGGQKELLRATLESVSVGVLLVNGEGHAIDWNAKFHQMWRIPNEVMNTADANQMIKSVIDRIKDPGAFMAFIEKLVQSTEESIDIIEMIDGQVIERTSFPLTKNNVLDGRVWCFRDISRERQAEEALRNRENLLRSTLESTADGILVVNGERRATHANKKFQQIWNIPDDILSQQDALLIREHALKQVKYPDQFLERLEELYLSDDEVYDVLEFKDGRIIERFSAPLSKGDVNAGRVWSFRDVTAQRKSEHAQKELQDQLERAERLESLGKLAGGVAHDLNNMLGPIVGYSEMLMNELPEKSKSAARAAKIKKSAEQAAVVIQDLLTLARRGKYEMRPVNVNDIVIEYTESPAFESLSTKYPGIKTKLDLSKNAGNILGSVPHLSKVIMNLVTNAYEAMPQNGKLIIATDRLSSRNGDYVILKVKDNGHGIAEGDKDKIFEPFYSKKQMGASGTGLGLSVVYGIMKDHKGLCDVQSQIGKGAEFTLYFPIAHSINAPKEGVQFSVVGGTETILVVDDSHDQRELMHEIVDNLGYFVVTAPDGRFAVDFIKSQEVDLVILDMIMEPGMDGLDTYREMLKINPIQKAIVVSGYSESERVQEILNLGAGIFVKKPFSMDTLAGAIRKALDRPDAVITDPEVRRQTHSHNKKQHDDKLPTEDSLTGIPGTFDVPFV